MNNAWDAVEYKAEIDYWKEKYEMEKSKNLELAKALMTYGQHRNDSDIFCERLKHSEYPCSCGFEAVINKAKGGER